MKTRYSRDVFGGPNTTSGIGNPYLFTGRRYDTETALYYYRARYYDYYLGRFLQPDLIGYNDGSNLYTYCINNPVVLVDPYGLWQFTIEGGYGLAGRITFGKNFGRINIGIAFGYGLLAKGFAGFLAGTSSTITKEGLNRAWLNRASEHFMADLLTSGALGFGLGLGGGYASESLSFRDALLKHGLTGDALEHAMRANASKYLMVLGLEADLISEVIWQGCTGEWEQ